MEHEPKDNPVYEIFNYKTMLVIGINQYDADAYIAQAVTSVMPSVYPNQDNEYLEYLRANW